MEKKSTIKTSTNGLSKELLIKRKACEKTWNVYWESISNVIKTPETCPSEDPYLIGRLFDRKTTDYQKIQSKYTSEMSKIFDQVIELDRERLKKQKQTLVDYLMHLKEWHRKELLHVERTLDQMNLVNGDEDVSNFVKKEADNLVPLQFVRNEELVRSIHVDVDRWGKIFRPGKIISSNWKPVHAIITKFGFFHFFDDAKQDAPTLTIKLSESVVNMRVPEEKYGATNVFELTIPNVGLLTLFNSTIVYPFRCENQESMIDWIVTLKRYCISTKKSGTRI